MSKDMTMNNESASRKLLMGFFRQRNTFFLVFALVVGLGAGYLAVTKPIYETHGSMLVKFGQNARSEAGAGERTDYTDADSHARQEVIKSYIKIILSHDLLLDLVKKFGAYHLYPDLRNRPSVSTDVPVEELAIKRLTDGDLKVSNDESHVIDVAIRNQDARVAVDFGSHVMDAFIRKRTEIYNTPQTDFLKQQIEAAHQRLQESQDSLQAFKQKAGISALDEELAQLLREKSDLTALAFTAITESQKRLSDLEEKEVDMEATYRTDSPMLSRLEETVQAARKELQKRRSDLNAQDGPGSGSSLAAKLGNVDKRVSFLEMQRGNYNELQQKVKLDEDNYFSYVKRGEEARINNLLNKEKITSIDVMDHPVIPAEPVKPKRSIVLALTLFAAIMAAVGVSLARELLDDRLTNPEQVHAVLGVPVFASFE
jgi:uncharacterized protein involved in exopolysaccharide biosynthesis